MKGTTVIVFIDPVFSNNPYLHWFALSGGGGGGGGRWREWRDSVNYPGEAASRVHTFLAWAGIFGKAISMLSLAISMLSPYSKAIKAAFQNHRCKNLKTLGARGRWCAAISASAAARWHGGRGGAETDIACLHLTGSFILRDSATRHQTHTGRWGEFPHNRVSLHTLDTLCLIWKPHDC